MQEVRWEGSGTEPAGEYTFFYAKGNEDHELGTGFLCIRESSAVKRVEFVSDRMSYIILRGRWCHIIVLNVHAAAEDKADDVKDSFSEGLERVFDKFRNLLSFRRAEIPRYRESSIFGRPQPEGAPWRDGMRPT
jgi:hypothetical protein